MIVSNRVVNNPPNLDASIWRYMALERFRFLIEQSSLFFSRADCLGDRFEGTFPRQNIETRLSRYHDRIPEWKKEHPGEDPEKKLSDFFRSWRQFVFVNCWHLNEHESAALWHIYADQNKGVAIRSTIAQLTWALDGNRDTRFYGSLVKYIDYDKEMIPEDDGLYPYIHKRRSYLYENEFRLLHEDPKVGQWPDLGEQTKVGVSFPISLDRLITSVYVSPGSRDDQIELVEALLATRSLRIKVVRSELDSPALF